MKTVHIYGQKFVTETGGFDPENEWSRNSTVTEWSIEGCSNNIPSQYYSFDSIETELTGKLFAVYTIYSGGDSFGRDESAYFDFIWVFDNLEMAQNAVAIIKDHADWYANKSAWNAPKKKDKRFDCDFSVDIDIGKNEPLTVCASWIGYDGSLDEVDIIEFEI